MGEQHDEQWAIPVANVFRVIAPESPHENQPSGMCPPYPWAIVCDTDPESVGGERAAAYARRIRAMGNACRKVPTEVIESGVIADLIREARVMANKCACCQRNDYCADCRPVLEALGRLEDKADA